MYSETASSIIAAARELPRARLELALLRTIDVFKVLPHNAKIDVPHLEQIKSLARATVKRFGKIDVPVNDAGVVQYKLFFQISGEEWDFVFTANMRKLYFCT